MPKSKSPPTMSEEKKKRKVKVTGIKAEDFELVAEDRYSKVENMEMKTVPYKASKDGLGIMLASNHPEANVMTTGRGDKFKMNEPDNGAALQFYNKMIEHMRVRRSSNSRLTGELESYNAVIRNEILNLEKRRRIHR